MTEQQNWKQFQGTELGGLMARLYGNENKPNINYPKPKQRKAAPPPVFIPGGAKHNAVDPRKSTRREVNIEVPVPTGGRRAQKFHQVDFIAHRKSADVMKNEIAEIKMRQTHYRPANSQAYSSDAEKDKFAQICQYKGGKALPEELTVS